jgi:hypothetical protein
VVYIRTTFFSLGLLAAFCIYAWLTVRLENRGNTFLRNVVTFHQTTYCHSPEHSTLHSHPLEDTKFRIIFILLSYFSFVGYDTMGWYKLFEEIYFVQVQDRRRLHGVISRKNTRTSTVKRGSISPPDMVITCHATHRHSQRSTKTFILKMQRAGSSETLLPIHRASSFMTHKTTIRITAVMRTSHFKLHCELNNMTL